MTQYPDERGKQYSGKEPFKGQQPFTSGSKGQPDQPYTSGSSSSGQPDQPYTSGSSSSGQPNQPYTSGTPGSTGPYTSSASEHPQYTGTGGQSQQYAASSGQQQPYTSNVGQSHYASRAQESRFGEEAGQAEGEGMGRPGALGLGMMAFTLVMLGAFYASFIIPSATVVRTAIAPLLFAGGIVEILAGMWAYRRQSSHMGTIFTAFGGFLLAVGYMFLPTGILAPLILTGTLRLVLGFLFLCWAIFSAVLLCGTIKVNSTLRAAVGLMALAFLILAIGHFAYNSIVLLRIGGWIAIVTALVAWAGTALDLFGKVGVHEDISQIKQQPAHRPVIAH